MRALLGPFSSPGANALVAGRVHVDAIRALAGLGTGGRVFVCESDPHAAAARHLELAGAGLSNVELHARPLPVVGEFHASSPFGPVAVVVCDAASADAAMNAAGEALEAVLVIDGAHAGIEAPGGPKPPAGFVCCRLHDGRMLLARHTLTRAPWLGDAFATFASNHDKRNFDLAGPGSSPEHLRLLRRHLQEILARGGFARLVDVGCHAGVLAMEAWRAGVAYVGIDVVPELIEDARRRFMHIPGATFVAADATRGIDVPVEGSLVVVKEVLQHLGRESRAALLAALDRFDDVLLVEDASLTSGEAPPHDGGYGEVSVEETRRAGYTPAYTYYVLGATKLVRGRTRTGTKALLMPPDSPATHTESAPEPVYETAFPGFGDLWALASEALDRSMLEGRPTLLARTMASGEDVGTRFTEILSVLDHGYGRVAIVDRPGTHDLNVRAAFGENPWRSGLMARRYRPTTQTWKREHAEAHVVVQLESLLYANGRYLGKKPGPFNAWRTLPQELVEAARKMLAETGLAIVELGVHLSVRECVEAARRARCFVGMDSGMAHLCHSVRVPMALFGYTTTDGTTERAFHGGHPYERFTDEESLRAALHKLLGET